MNPGIKIETYLHYVLVEKNIEIQKHIARVVVMEIKHCIDPYLGKPS